MSRWLLALVLAVAPATAWAQSAPVPTAQSAQADVSKTERRVATLTITRNTLAKQLEDQLKVVDRLKQQRASWRRDRDLKAALADAQSTSSKVAAAATELALATKQLQSTRKVLVVAIDTELASLDAGPASAQRRTVLVRAKAQLSPAVAKKTLQKIVLPALEIDPLADPEELDAQAQELLRAEQELERQAVGLDQQSKNLDEVARIRKQHERATVLAQRDDDQPQRSARTSSGDRGTATSDDAAAPEVSGGAGNGSDGGAGGELGGAGFEAVASVVLSGVVDQSTIDTLTRSQRSGDPTQRAQAARKTRDAVKLRLDQLRKKRLEIQAAAAKSRR